MTTLELKSALIPDYAGIRVVIVPVDVMPPAVLHKYTTLIEAQVGKKKKKKKKIQNRNSNSFLFFLFLCFIYK
jgi:hypothetical protein